jgi:hypothetical protein
MIQAPTISGLVDLLAWNNRASTGPVSGIVDGRGPDLDRSGSSGSIREGVQADLGPQSCGARPFMGRAWKA